MFVTALGSRGAGMPTGYSKYVGREKNTNIPASSEDLDDLLLLRDGKDMSTRICSATESDSVAVGSQLLNTSPQGFDSG